MRLFTMDELRQYNGKGSAPCYVSYKDIIYDVTGSFTWKKGTHQVLHEAGRDLTQSLEQAPHGPELLEKFPIVGKLVVSLSFVLSCSVNDAMLKII